ncbi:MAG TPA: response regulator [Candidatus Dormibacteraeota bacterium]|nr:response regulator [Candidatus Dormibacteraeota bacterium]
MAEKAKILIVDDERDLVDAYVRLLERAGHRCVGAFGAHEAIEMIDAETPDLVLTDLSLPDSNGLEVIRHLRAKSAIIPIIVMSGHNTQGMNEAARAAGANLCLLKPVSIAELKRVIGDALKRYYLATRPT